MNNVDFLYISTRKLVLDTFLWQSLIYDEMKKNPVAPFSSVTCSSTHVTCTTRSNTSAQAGGGEAADTIREERKREIFEKRKMGDLI